MMKLMPHKSWMNVAAALFLTIFMSSCTKVITDSRTETGQYIEFSTTVGTKAPVESADQISEFAVWGYYGQNGAYTDVFGQTGTENTGTEVRGENGAWVYDNLKKWQFGVPYNFYAVYPADAVHEMSSSDASGGAPFISIKGYDLTEDLMFASVEGMVQPEGAVPSPVQLEFCHLLSRVDFVAKTDPLTLENLPDFEAVVTEAKLYGMPKSGDLSLENFDPADMSTVVWQPENPTTQDAPFRDISGRYELGTPQGTSLSLFGELFMLPAATLSGYVLEIHWTVTAQKDGTPVPKSQIISLSSPAVLNWSAGSRYRYTFTISDTDHILFEVPTVTPWDDASGGIIVVD